MARLNLRNRRTLYILLGVSIAVLSIGLAFLNLGIRQPLYYDEVSEDTTLTNTGEYDIDKLAVFEEEFQLSTYVTPGNTDEYDERIISIYIERDQDLYVSFRAEGAPIMLNVYTPSEQVLGYSFGDLESNRCIASQQGNFKYQALETGTYVMYIKSATPSGIIDVTMKYWIV